MLYIYITWLIAHFNKLIFFCSDVHEIVYCIHLFICYAYGDLEYFKCANGSTLQWALHSISAPMIMKCHKMCEYKKNVVSRSEGHYFSTHCGVEICAKTKRQRMQKIHQNILNAPLFENSTMVFIKLQAGKIIKPMLFHHHSYSYSYIYIKRN